MDEEIQFQENFYADEVSNESEGIVNVATLNVRDFPDKTAKSIKILQEGEVVTIIDHVYDVDMTDEWYHISQPINGFCKAEFIDI